jgi:methylated-DNA-protein-cysteine methyltransferase-like protein
MPDSNFFNDVYDVVRLIPSGRVTSYGAIAEYLGTKSSARMVGWALNSLKGDSTVPAHRVLNRLGILTGKVHFGEPDIMRMRLEEEGIIVKEDRVLNFEAVYWDPSKELLL